MTKRLLEAFQKAQTVPIPITLEDGTAFNVAWSVTDSRSSGIGGIFFDLAWEQETDSARTLTGGDRQATPEAGHSQIGI